MLVYCIYSTQALYVVLVSIQEHVVIEYAEYTY
jgi:hypothetical protein